MQYEYILNVIKKKIKYLSKRVSVCDAASGLHQMNRSIQHMYRQMEEEETEQITC